MLKEQHYPFTMIDHGAENEGINFVDLDFDYALHACVEYLAGLGHKHLAFINDSSELINLGMGYVVRSENAFRYALAQWALRAFSVSVSRKPRPIMKPLRACLHAIQQPRLLLY
jgi:DNA-binding LacI/PurR family transcriptional regulator